MRIRRLIRCAAIGASILGVGSWLPAHAGGTAQAAGSRSSGLPVCFSQAAGQRVPGVALSGPRLHGLTVDPKSGRVFVFASGVQAAGGKPICRAAVLTLSGWNGRVIHVTRLGNTMEPTFYTAMAVAPGAHRLLFLSTGDLRLSPTHQLPGTNNRLFIMDTRTGALLKSISLPRGANLRALAVDNATYRAFVSYEINGAVPQEKIAVVAITRGTILRTIDGIADGLAVDQRTNRVFLLASGQVTTIDGGTGNTIATATLPSQNYIYNGYGVDERAGRLLVTELGLSAPHSGVPNPPSMVATIDTSSGQLIRQVAAGREVVAGNLAVDPPAGIALSMGSNTGSTRATVVNTSTGAVERTVSLALPYGGFAWAPPGIVQATPVFDPRDGTIYGYTRRGLRAVAPGRWNTARVVTTNGAILPLGLVADPVTHRGFGLELAVPSTDVVRAFCLRANCK